MKGVKENFEDIKRTIADSGCECLPEEYTDCLTRLKIRCSCGEVYERTWRKFKMGRTLCPKCAYKASGEKRRKPKKEKPKKEKKPKERTEPKVLRADGFQPCTATAKRSLHKRLDKWRKLIRDTYGNECAITGQKEANLTVHHLRSLDMIFSEIANNHGVDCRLKDKHDYESRQLYLQILREVRQRHDVYAGILIAKDIHEQFHKEYGYGDNTPEQFDEFLHNRYGTSLQDIQARYIKKGE